MKHENDCKLKAKGENSEISENSWVFQTYLSFYYSSFFQFAKVKDEWHYIITYPKVIKTKELLPREDNKIYHVCWCLGQSHTWCVDKISEW